MTLPQFLDVSYALLAEEHQRIDPYKDLVSVRELLLPSGEAKESIPTVREVAAKNAAAVAELNSMMAGVQRRR